MPRRLGRQMPTNDELPNDWREALGGCPTDEDITKILDEVNCERESGTPIYPPSGTIFAALELTPFSNVRAVIVGQDPYHQEGQAHGLAFSVPPGVRPPPSLRNILKALGSDLGIPVPIDGCLEP